MQTAQETTEKAIARKLFEALRDLRNNVPTLHRQGCECPRCIAEQTADRAIAIARLEGI